MGLWIDTDFGFDDLWALLMLHARQTPIDGVSLVAGNTTLEKATRNALGAVKAFGLAWPLSSGAAVPLARPLETAHKVLGPRAMQTRGENLPEPDETTLPPAIPALANWLKVSKGPHTILALGPLTNLALLLKQDSAAFSKITRLVWMGGSAQAGNHTPHAEFNAHVDAEAVKAVAQTGVAMDIVDLEACRQATYAEQDIPKNMKRPLADLMGGYLDIALSRGRQSMPIYDPLAALALLDETALDFQNQDLHVDISSEETYGKTSFTPNNQSSVRLAVTVDQGAAKQCVDLLGMIQR